MNKEQKTLLLTLLMDLEFSFKEMNREEEEFIEIVEIVNEEFELKYFEETSNIGKYNIH